MYYRNYANKIEKGFETVSIIQCKEAIDEWFDFNLKVKEFIDENDELENLKTYNKIIVVDIQPSYIDYINFDIEDFTNWLNKNKNSKILYLFNGKELGYEDEYDIKNWLYDNGLKMIII